MTSLTRAGVAPRLTCRSIANAARQQAYSVNGPFPRDRLVDTVHPLGQLAYRVRLARWVNSISLIFADGLAQLLLFTGARRRRFPVAAAIRRK